MTTGCQEKVNGFLHLYSYYLTSVKQRFWERLGGSLHPLLPLALCMASFSPTHHGKNCLLILLWWEPKRKSTERIQQPQLTAISGFGLVGGFFAPGIVRYIGSFWQDGLLWRAPGSCILHPFFSASFSSLSITCPVLRAALLWFHEAALALVQGTEAVSVTEGGAANS